jgi:hypothetical protein
MRQAPPVPRLTTFKTSSARVARLAPVRQPRNQLVDRRLPDRSTVLNE